MGPWNFRISLTSKNQIIKILESSLKCDKNSKRYQVELLWKTEEQRLEDNENIADNRFAKFRKKKLLKTPELYFEYAKVLDYRLIQRTIHWNTFRS